MVKRYWDEMNFPQPTDRELKENALEASSRLSNLISFVRKACEGGNEPMILATRLTSDTWSSRFIGTFGNEDYEKLAGDMEISADGVDGTRVGWMGYQFVMPAHDVDVHVEFISNGLA